MNAIEQAQQPIDRLNRTQPNLTQIRAIAKEYGKNQDTADELWKQGGNSARLLALLMLDLKAITMPAMDHMIADIEAAAPQDQRQVCDWLIANVIMQKSALKNEAMHWRLEPSLIKQRIFWSVQARTIKAEHQERNTDLLEVLKRAWLVRMTLSRRP